MTKKYVVADEQVKKFHDRLWELESCWRKNILEPEQTLDGLQLLIENKRMMVVPAVDYSPLLADWEAFYRNLGIDCGLSDVIIPDDPGGFNQVIVMAKGITPQSAYDLCAKNFPCWKCTDDDLDKIVTSDRTAKDGSYAIRVRNRVEADEELKNLSANHLKQQNIPGITLEEREIFELKFFKETNRHLDIKNWTLCAGSRCSFGPVPGVNWFSAQFMVHWRPPGFARAGLRSRYAVS